MAVPKLDTDDIIDEAFTHALADTVNDLGRIASGTVGVVFAGTSAETAVVTLPAGRFSAAPAISLEVLQAAGTTNGSSKRVTTRSTSSFTLSLSLTGAHTGTINIMWIAHQP